MRRRHRRSLAVGLVAPVLAAFAGCGTSGGPPPSGFNWGGGDAGRDGSVHHGDAAQEAPPPLVPFDAMAEAGPCPEGAETATITGTVFDPAGKNPLFNVAVYIPAVPLTPLPRGVPTGASACSCTALFPTAAYASASTAVDGTFTLTNVPIGNQKLVVQLGKWRKQISIHVTRPCTDAAPPSYPISLPSTVPAGDTDDNMPDIAVSTGFADSLECLLRRVGISTTEYVAGNDPAGHVHLFSGGDPSIDLSTFAGGGIGATEWNPMPGSPQSATSLWSTASQLMPFDVLLLSCEGGETYNANPQALESYLNAGGRAFASHWHYSWFAGPLTSGQSYSAPADWGSNLAAWDPVLDSSQVIGGVIDTTLNGSTLPFGKGRILAEWLAEVGALGVNAPPGELSLWEPKEDARVSAANVPSQPWILADSASSQAGSAMYFSFDTPVHLAPGVDAGAHDAGVSKDSGAHEGGIQRDASAREASVSSDARTGETGISSDARTSETGVSRDGGGMRDARGTVDAASAPETGSGSFATGPTYCGRAVYSDLHVGGDPTVTDAVTVAPSSGGLPAPQGCNPAELSPQEKALEFMLFDLSSCVTDDAQPVPDAGTVVVPPPK